jgi:hypothetical protein
VAVERAVADLDEAVADFLNKGTTEVSAIFAAAFALNNEIGRKLKPSGDPELKRLQLLVNDVVVAAKRRNHSLLTNAMEKLRTEHLRRQNSR